MMFTIGRTAISGDSTEVSILCDGVVGVSYPSFGLPSDFKSIRSYRFGDASLKWRDNDAAKRIRFAIALKKVSLDGVGSASVGTVGELFKILSLWHQCKEDYERVIELTDTKKGMLFSTPDNRFVFHTFVESPSPFYIEEWVDNYKKMGYSPRTDSMNTLLKDIYFSVDWLMFRDDWDY